MKKNPSQSSQQSDHARPSTSFEDVNLNRPFNFTAPISHNNFQLREDVITIQYNEPRLNEGQESWSERDEAVSSSSSNEWEWQIKEDEELLTLNESIKFKLSERNLDESEENEHQISSSLTPETTMDISIRRTLNKMSMYEEALKNNEPQPSVIKEPVQSVSTLVETSQLFTDTMESASKGIIMLKQMDYYTIPKQQELLRYYNANGSCIIKNFMVCRQNYGQIKFYGEFNVAGLDIDKLINISHQHITVYPDARLKPPKGKGFNKPASITLYNIRCYDSDQIPSDNSTNILDIDMLVKKLIVVAQLVYGGQHERYSCSTGSWLFKVEHFDNYACEKEVYKLGDIFFQNLKCLDDIELFNKNKHLSTERDLVETEYYKCLWRAKPFLSILISTCLVAGLTHGLKFATARRDKDIFKIVVRIPNSKLKSKVFLLVLAKSMKEPKYSITYPIGWLPIILLILKKLQETTYINVEGLYRIMNPLAKWVMHEQQLLEENAVTVTNRR